MPKGKKVFSDTFDDDLQLPLREHRFGDVAVSVYKVKDHEDADFLHTVLLRILKKARGSYARYGQVPPVDSFDAKASIYLARTKYSFVSGGQSATVEEWCSVRFIPASGEPFSTEDLEACVYQGTSMSFKIQEILFQNHAEALDRLVTVSRICRITPKIFEEKKMKTVGLKIPKKNTHTGLSLFLMSKAFLEESKIKNKKYDWFTALATPELFEKVLRFSWKGKDVHFPFLPADDVLPLPSDEKIRMDRPFLSYKYPGYFLHRQDLFSFFSELISLGKITEEIFQKISGLAWVSLAHLKNHESLTKKERLQILQGFSKIFLHEGWIEEGKTHSDEIRMMCEKKVKDAVRLYLSSIEQWKKHFYELETLLF